MKMKQPKYLGNSELEKLLNKYGSVVPTHIVKMRIIGAILSPNLQLRPIEVICSFWPDGKEPRMVTSDEADKFFSCFMGLWYKISEKIKTGKVSLCKVKGFKSIYDAEETIKQRIEEIEYGFLEGFWGGKKDMPMPQIVTDIIDGLSEMTSSYYTLLQRLSALDETDDDGLKKIAELSKKSDKMAEKAIAALIRVMGEIRPKKPSVN